jgi:hypothetical protein
MATLEEFWSFSGTALSKRSNLILGSMETVRKRSAPKTTIEDARFASERLMDERPVLMGILKRLFEQELGEYDELSVDAYFALSVEKVILTKPIHRSDLYEVVPRANRVDPTAWVEFSATVRGDSCVRWSMDASLWISMECANPAMVPFGGRVGVLVGVGV